MVSLSDIQHIFKGKIILSAPLAQFTSLSVGGPADYVLEPSTDEETEQLVAYFKKNDFPFVVVKPDVLVSTKGFRGAAIVPLHNRERASLLFGAKLFKSANGVSPSELLEQAGLNGLILGGAEIVGNCIVNANKATPDELLALVRHVQGVLKTQLGVELALELQLVGFDQETFAQVA